MKYLRRKLALVIDEPLKDVFSILLDEFIEIKTARGDIVAIESEEEKKVAEFFGGRAVYDNENKCDLLLHMFLFYPNSSKKVSLKSLLDINAKELALSARRTLYPNNASMHFVCEPLDQYMEEYKKQNKDVVTH